jgi:hypothetical protein
MRNKSKRVEANSTDTALHVFKPLSKTELRALEKELPARSELDKRIRQLREKKCHKHPMCRTFVRSCREKSNHRHVKALAMPCGRFTCGECYRDWMIHHLRKACDQLLYATGSMRPRTGTLYVRDVKWSEWAAVSKAIRRVDSRCGRVRIRHGKGLCLVIAEATFPGSTRVAPPDAAILAMRALDEVRKSKHSTLYLGGWKQRVEIPDGEWEVVIHKRDIKATLDEAVALGAVTVPGRKSATAFAAVFGEHVPDDRVKAYWDWLGNERLPCPSLSVKEHLERTGNVGQPYTSGYLRHSRT